MRKFANMFGRKTNDPVHDQRFLNVGNFVVCKPQTHLEMVVIVAVENRFTRYIKHRTFAVTSHKCMHAFGIQCVFLRLVKVRCQFKMRRRVYNKRNVRSCASHIVNAKVRIPHKAAVLKTGRAEVPVLERVIPRARKPVTRKLVARKLYGIIDAQRQFGAGQ